MGTSDQLEKSVLPVFVASEDGKPARDGSCVLVHLLGRHFIVTAGHVLRNTRGRPMYAGRQGHKLIQVSEPGFFTTEEDEHLDIAVIPLNDRELSKLVDLVFIPEDSLELEDVDHQGGPANDHVVFGWPESNSQFRIDRRPGGPRRNIRQNSFTLQTKLATPEIGVRENISSESHLVLEFNPNEITVDGRRHNPPDPHGISGGGAFRVVNGRLRLAGIMTEYRRPSRVIVGTRMSQVAAFVENVVESENL
jgi:hypothetical protein